MERATLPRAVAGSLTAANVVAHLRSARGYAMEAAGLADAERECAECNRRDEVRTAWSTVHRECIEAIADLDDAIEACER